MTNEEKDDEMICGLTADERNVLQRGLRALPDTTPPRVVWNRIQEQAAAEGLFQHTAVRRAAIWYGGIGLAAAILLAVAVVPMMMNNPTLQSSVTEPAFTLQQNPMELSALQALMVQSQQLESDLRALPKEPRVMRASTMATISDLEDRIAAIDYQLNDTIVQMTPDEKQIFWRERVRLMNSLVQLRFAQAQRTTF